MFALALLLTFLQSTWAMTTGCICDGLFWSSSGNQAGFPQNTVFQTEYCSNLQTYPATSYCGGSSAGPGRTFNVADVKRANSGYCIKNNQLTAQTVSHITTGILNNVETNYVNITGTRLWCYGSATTIATTAQRQTCANQQTNAIIGFLQNRANTCAYPTNDNFLPTACDCSFVCTNNFVKCGTECINPSTQTCQSGVPRSLRRRSQICPPGAQKCKVSTGGHECLNTSSNLEACGGCPGAGGVDCSEEEGVAHVQCLAGECVKHSCLAHYQLVNGTCVPETSPVPKVTRLERI